MSPKEDDLTLEPNPNPNQLGDPNPNRNSRPDSVATDTMQTILRMLRGCGHIRKYPGWVECAASSLQKPEACPIWVVFGAQMGTRRWLGIRLTEGIRDVSDTNVDKKIVSYLYVLSGTASQRLCH